MFLHLLFHGPAKEQQDGHGGCQGRQDEIGCADEYQEQGAADESGHGRDVGPCRLPLVHADDHEQGGHGKINASGVKLNQFPHERAKHRAKDPVALVKQGDKEGGLLPFPVRKIRRAGHGAEQGVCLVRQGEDHVRISLFHFLKTFNEGQAVKCMAAVDEQGHDGRGDEAQAPGEDAYQGKLHGACVDKGTDEEGPQDAKAGFLKQEPECNPQKNISQEDRDSLD